MAAPIKLLMKVTCALVFDICGYDLELSACTVEIKTAGNLNLHADFRLDLKA